MHLNHDQVAIHCIGRARSGEVHKVLVIAVTQLRDSTPSSLNQMIAMILILSLVLWLFKFSLLELFVFC